ncbi:MAG TPA: hypothetical protein VEI52_16695 [Terriglobales bacterium]|nr:hypothetical protein [Terriglobales bacterium]
MKKLDCSNFVGKVKDAAPSTNFLGKPLVAVLCSLLLASLLAGCSQKHSKSAGSETQTSTNQMTLNPPPVPNPTASALPAATTPEPKKVVKKRPSTVTYSDQTSGVSFRYPRKSTLKSGDDIDTASVPMDFVQPGGVTTVSVELPRSLYPDTDLTSAFFRVDVNRGLTENECGQFTLPLSLGSDKDPVQPSKVGLGALEMQEVENISGEEMKRADTKYYHLFQNGACYEFVLGLSMESDGAGEKTATVDRDKVFQRLETILATVKIKPEATPQVAAGAVATPTAHDEVVK